MKTRSTTRKVSALLHYYCVDPLREVLGFDLDNSMQEYQGQDLHQPDQSPMHNNTLYLEKNAETLDAREAEAKPESYQGLVTDDIKGIMKPSKGKFNLPGFNNSFDFNRS